MDRRQQKTRDAIFDAFIGLLAQKNYNKITVQEIIDAANVGRSTFYAHFETKDHLLREICADLFSHVFSDSLTAESTHDFSFTTGNPKAIITHMLYHLRDNKRNIIGILNTDRDELFIRFFKEYLNNFLVPYFIDNNTVMERIVPADYLVCHISASFINLVQWWIKNGLAQSPEELSEYFLAVIRPIFTKQA